MHRLDYGIKGELPPLKTWRIFRHITGYLTAIGAVAVALAGRWILEPWLEHQLMFSALYAAIAVTVWVAGWKPALLAAIAGYVATVLITGGGEPDVPFSFELFGSVAGLVVYLGSSVIIIALGQRMLAARERARIATVERLQKQRQLEESEERFRRLADAAPALIWISGPDKLCTWFNRQWLEFVGRPMEQELGNGWTENVHPEDFDRCLRTYLQAFDARQPFSMEYRLRRHDGEYRWVLDNGTPSYGSNGDFMGYVGSAIDISERRCAQEALEAANLQLQIITDTMPAPVTRCSRDLHYLWVSKPYSEWIGRPQSEIVGHPISEILGEEAFRNLLPRFRKVLAGEPVQYEEQVNFRGIGPRWIHAVYTPTIDAEGHVDGWVAIVHDITERKQLEDARESGRRKDEFLAILAHELRNPLAPVRNAVHILRMQGAPIADLEWARDAIDRQMKHMGRLIDDLLDLSRIAKNVLELRTEQVELNKVLEAAVETSRPLIEAAGHRLDVSLLPDPVYLDADNVRLAQVFSNLLNNAAKYSERPGTIALTASREGDHVVVSVRDDGIGIPKVMLEQIFEMFSQVEGPVERRQGGLGIGLTIAKRLVDMHGGTIEAHSDGLGKGSEFIVRLPMLASVVRTSRPATAGIADTEAKKCRVLVADDNMDAAISLSRMLSLLHYETRAAYDGLQAVQTAGEFLPDVVLLDIGMPKLSGYDVARRIREAPWGKDMVLIAVTGWGQAKDKTRAREAGFKHHLIKPVDPSALAQLLASEAEHRAVM